MERPEAMAARDIETAARHAGGGRFRNLPPTLAVRTVLYWRHHQQRKEVIQCLSPSAVTSLGSPAERLFMSDV
ncbi:hypothetical protein [Bradyrhizobium sp. SZCCHNRI3043]|uniref:hypothetical protein n=1 Tax=Bradyrhizobium sp. SZCCHNRI3043 TaxID=3057292 RepID=UPI0028EFB1BD|nr:hypothetical protein [Bradyrhizobium sp. SZCCHNRI3043]